MVHFSPSLAAMVAVLPDPAPAITSRGVSGEEIKDMLRRFDRDVIAEKPDLVLWQLGTMPTVGARVSVPGLVFEVVSLEGRSIDQVRITSGAGTAR